MMYERLKETFNTKEEYITYVDFCGDDMEMLKSCISDIENGIDLEEEESVIYMEISAYNEDLWEKCKEDFDNAENAIKALRDLIDTIEDAMREAVNTLLMDYNYMV